MRFCHFHLDGDDIMAPVCFNNAQVTDTPLIRAAEHLQQSPVLGAGSLLQPLRRLHQLVPLPPVQDVVQNQMVSTVRSRTLQTGLLGLALPSITRIALHLCSAAEAWTPARSLLASFLHAEDCSTTAGWHWLVSFLLKLVLPNIVL